MKGYRWACGSLDGIWVWTRVFGVIYVDVYEIMLNVCLYMHMLPFLLDWFSKDALIFLHH